MCKWRWVYIELRHLFRLIAEGKKFFWKLDWVIKWRSSSLWKSLLIFKDASFRLAHTYTCKPNWPVTWGKWSPTLKTVYILAVSYSFLDLHHWQNGPLSKIISDVFIFMYMYRYIQIHIDILSIRLPLEKNLVMKLSSVIMVQFIRQKKKKRQIWPRILRERDIDKTSSLLYGIWARRSKK